VNVRDMDARTLRALADELEREARRFRTNWGEDDGDWPAKTLEAFARTYRKRARLAKGGWAVAEKDKKT
jgi:hypothetical protein